MDDEAVENMLRALIEERLAEPERSTAIHWLELRARTYRAVLELGLIDDNSAD